MNEKTTWCSPFDRREFLRLGSAVAAFAATGGALHAAPRAPLAVRQPLALSVGFTTDPEGLIDARSVPGGDGRFLAQGADVRIDGFTPAAGGNLPLDLVLCVLSTVAIDGAPRTIPITAAVQRAGSLSRASVPVRYRLPVDPDGAIAFELVAQAGGEETFRETIRLSVTSAKGALALRSGTYVLAVHEAKRSPDWRSLRMSEEEGEGRLERRFPELDPALAFHTAVIRVSEIGAPRSSRHRPLTKPDTDAAPSF